MIKILVVGSSYIGALVGGWNVVRESYQDICLDFVGAPGQGMRGADVINGMITGTGLKARCTEHIEQYDAFVVFGDLPSPRNIYRYYIGASNYSSAVKAQALADLVENSLDMYIVRELIQPFSKAPIVVVSRPENRSATLALSHGQYVEATNFLCSILTGDGMFYLAPPRSTLDENFEPVAEYYDGAVDVEGKTADEQELAALGHFNIRGGIAVIEELSTTLRRVLYMAS